LIQIDGIDELLPRIVVSVVYSYDVIIEAAKKIQMQFKWGDDSSIKSLMFSPIGFLIS
jgi:hypothetical protein